jgi:hypothetical protein
VAESANNTSIHSLLADAKRDFSKWFGGFEVTHKHGGVN